MIYKSTKGASCISFSTLSSDIFDSLIISILKDLNLFYFNVIIRSNLRGFGAWDHRLAKLSFRGASWPCPLKRDGVCHCGHTPALHLLAVPMSYPLALPEGVSPATASLHQRGGIGACPWSCFCYSILSISKTLFAARDKSHLYRR